MAITSRTAARRTAFFRSFMEAFIGIRNSFRWEQYSKRNVKNEEVFGIQLCAKESAFMSKELATIKTDIESIAQVNLDDIKLNIDYTELKNRLLDLEIKTLI